MIKMVKKIIISLLVLVSSVLTASAAPVVNVSNGQIVANFINGQYITGSTTTVNMWLSEAPDGLSGYNITVSLSNTSVAEIMSVSFPAWATVYKCEKSNPSNCSLLNMYANGSLPGNSVFLTAIDLNKSLIGATNIILATLTIRSDNIGSTSIIPATINRMDNATGNATVPTIVPGTLNIYMAGDFTGDNNKVDFNDVVYLAKHYYSFPGYNLRSSGDFTRDGKVDFNDVVYLAKYYYGFPCCGNLNPL